MMQVLYAVSANVLVKDPHAILPVQLRFLVVAQIKEQWTTTAQHWRERLGESEI